MTVRIYVFLIVLFAVVANGCKNRGSFLSAPKKGGIDGNGGGNIVDELNPWFVGKDPVKYCVRAAPGGFSLGEEKVKPVIRLAIDDWTKTLNALIKLNSKYAGLAHQLTLDFQGGPCGAATELEFLLGAFNEHVEDELTKGSKIKVALASRYKQSEPEVNRKKGYIWLSPDQGPRAYAGDKHQDRFWQDATTFANVLKHELGHVFGMSHGTIALMQRDLPKYVVAHETIGLTSYDLFQTRLDQAQKLGCFKYVPLSEPKVNQGNVLEEWLGFSYHSWCLSFQTIGKVTSVKISSDWTEKDGTTIIGKLLPMPEAIAGKYRDATNEDVRTDFLHFFESVSLSGIAKIKGRDIPAKVSTSWFGARTLRVEFLFNNEWYQFDLVEAGVRSFLEYYLENAGSVNGESIEIAGGKTPAVSGRVASKPWQSTLGVAELHNRWGKKLNFRFVEGDVNGTKIYCDPRDGGIRLQHTEGHKVRSLEIVVPNSLGIVEMTEAAGGPRATFGTIDNSLTDWATSGAVEVTSITEDYVEGRIIGVGTKDGANLANGRFKIPLCRYKGWIGIEE